MPNWKINCLKSDSETHPSVLSLNDTSQPLSSTPNNLEQLTAGKLDVSLALARQTRTLRVSRLRLLGRERATGSNSYRRVVMCRENYRTHLIYTT